MSIKQVLKDVLFGGHHGTTTDTSRGQLGSSLGTTTMGGTSSNLAGSTTYLAPTTSNLGTTTSYLSTSNLVPGLVSETHSANVLPENIQVNALPAEVRVEERPAVIREIVHPSEKVELNPIIYRERELTEVRQVEQPIYETFRKPAVVIEKAGPAENRPVIQPQRSDFDLKYREGLDKYKSSVEYAPVETETITKAPVVIETIRKQVREEIQPVIFREIWEPHVIKETRPIYEKIIEPPTLFRVSNQPLQKGEVLLTPDVLSQQTIGVGGLGHQAPINLMGQTSNLMGQTSNLGVGGLGHQTPINLMGQTSNLVGQTSNLMGQTSNLMGQTSSLGVGGMGHQTPNLMGQGTNLMGQNLGVKTNVDQFNQIPIQQQSFGQLPPKTNVEMNEPRSFIGSSSS